MNLLRQLRIDQWTRIHDKALLLENYEMEKEKDHIPSLFLKKRISIKLSNLKKLKEELRVIYLTILLK